MILNFSPVQPGDLVYRPKTSGLGLHYGTGISGGVIAHTMPNIGKHVGTLDEFSDGKPVTIVRPLRTPIQNHAIEQIALSDLGKPYHEVTANCEHDVYAVHAGSSQSPTVNNIRLAGLAFLAIALLNTFSDG